MSDGEKTYSENEVKKILDRALRIQKTETRRMTGEQGLSFSDLRHAAEEAGINPELVSRAARELEEGRRSGFLGESVRPEERLTVNASVSREGLQALLGELQGITGMKGSGRLTGNGLSWKSDVIGYPVSLPGLTGNGEKHGESGNFVIIGVGMAGSGTGERLEVEVRPAGSGTEITTRTRLEPVAGGIFGGLLGGLGLGGGLGVGLGVGIGALGSVLFSTLVPLGFLAGSWLLARTIFRLVVRAVKKREREVLENIRGFLEGEVRRETSGRNPDGETGEPVE